MAAVRSTIDGFAATQHTITNQRISFDSRTTGRYTAYIQAQHWADRDRWYLIGGWYENEVRRTGDGYMTPTGTPFSGDHIQAMCRAVARIHADGRVEGRVELGLCVGRGLR